jgi:single-stranded-DNA-specific exonuclease
VISHKEDPDGICSAAMIKAAVKANKIILSDYPNMITKLEELDANSANEKIEQLFICDLGLSKKNQDQFVKILSGFATNGTEVTYIDHHDIPKEIQRSLKQAGVNLIHNLEECTSIQVYDKFKKQLPDAASFIAAIGALTDYMEDTPIASMIVPRFDKQFLMLQSTALSYMVSASQRNDEFLVDIVDVLSKMKYPHDIKNGFALAEEYAKKVSEAAESISKSMAKRKNLVYAENSSKLSTSTIVNFVLGQSGKPVALVYRYKKEIDSYIFSIRGSADCKVHLGRLVNEVSTGLDGTGGGHEKACGAMIPNGKLNEFIKTLNRCIG